MLTAALLLSAQADPVAAIDRLARVRDVTGLNQIASPELVHSDAFRFLKRGGAYGVGETGWSALKLNSVDGGKTYVVFTTQISCEDIGEQVFELKGGRLVSRIDEANDAGNKLRKWDFDVRFDIPRKSVSLQASATVDSNPNASDEILFRLSPQYRVESIVTSLGSPVTFHQAGGVVSVARVLQPTTEYVFQYRAHVENVKGGGSMTANEATLTGDYWYPMIARKPAPFTITVHAPKHWEVVAQGEVTADEDQEQEHVVSFRMDVPVTFLSLSVGRYRHVSKVVNGITYHVWSMVLTSEQLQEQLDFMPPIVEFYNKTFSPMPFSRFGTLVSSLYHGGALEAYSFATYDPEGLPYEDAHEPAHTWFGGMLDNTYLKSFWNESFADWCEGYYHRFGPIGNVSEKARAMVPTPNANPEYWKGTCEGAGALAGPVAGNLGYGKGADVLLQMESEFPETVRWARQWVESRPDGESVGWSDFEKVCGPETKWFFDQWTRRKGFPRFTISNVKYRSGAVTGNVSFLGDPYRLTADVLVQGRSGSRQVSVTLNPNRLKNSVWSVSTPFKPIKISLDPWGKLLIERPKNGPLRLIQEINKKKLYVDPSVKEWASSRSDLIDLTKAVSTVPKRLEGWTLVARPNAKNGLAALLARQGITVRGDTVTYDGTTIDLNHGFAGAVVDLPSGKHCVVLMGKTGISPQIGHARLALTDDLGRLLRAKTDPRVNGPLAFKL